MSIPQVHILPVDKPITVLGKIFQGDYAKSKDYVFQIQQELLKEEVSFIPYKVMGVYYDNPQEKKPEELRSFQGVFLSDEDVKIPEGFEKVSLKGRYLYTKVKGDPMKAIFDGYGALFSYIQQNKSSLKTPAGYQVSTFENGEMTTEIYMELDN